MEIPQSALDGSGYLMPDGSGVSFTPSLLIEVSPDEWINPRHIIRIQWETERSCLIHLLGGLTILMSKSSVRETVQKIADLSMPPWAFGVPNAG